MLTHARATELLSTYTLAELLETSDLSEEDVLIVLAEQGLLTLPETQPL
jgi:hypothetical protein